MFRKSRIAALCLASSALAVPALAQLVYPVQNQLPEQQKQDESRCVSWAMQQSDFDPAKPWLAPQAFAPASTAGSSSSIRGGTAAAIARGAMHPDAGDAAVAAAIVAASTQASSGTVDSGAKRRESTAAGTGADGVGSTPSAATSARTRPGSSVPTILGADATAPAPPATSAAAAAIVGRDAASLTAGGAVAAAALRHDTSPMLVLQQEQTVPQQQLAAKASFEKSRIECLEARGYTVQ